MSDQQPCLRIDAVQQADAYLIRVQGELDLSVCPDLDLALAEAEQTQAGRIILDLEELTFIDAAGLGTLLKACRRSANNGNRLRLTRGNGHPAELFRLTALDVALPLTHPSLCPAIRDSGSVPESVPDAVNGPRIGAQFVDGPNA